MSAAAALVRRHTRSAARGTTVRLLAVAAGEAAEGPAAAAAAAAQPRKRQRKATAGVKAAGDDTVAPAAEDAPENAAVALAPATKRATGGKAKAEPAAAAAAAARAAAKAAGGPSRLYEEELWQQGFARVAGIDEAGRGPLAGPVVAAACVVPEHVRISGIDDSKKLSAQQREAIYGQLTAHPDILWAAHVIDAGEIDGINILQAALKAMERAAAGLSTQPDFLLVDGNRLPKGFDPERSRAIVKGDSKSLCIAAASVIAKVTRDRLMEQYHEQYPQYNFKGHKGYCVPEHVEAIRKHGPCPLHRRTFAPIRHLFPLEQPADAAGEGASEQQEQEQEGKKVKRRGTGKATASKKKVWVK